MLWMVFYILCCLFSHGRFCILSSHSEYCACKILGKTQQTSESSCALSLLLTGAGEILIDFQDMMHSLEEEEEEELLRRTSLLVQTQRLV